MKVARTWLRVRPGRRGSWSALLDSCGPVLSEKRDHTPSSTTLIGDDVEHAVDRDRPSCLGACGKYSEGVRVPRPSGADGPVEAGPAAVVVLGWDEVDLLADRFFRGVAEECGRRCVPQPV